MSLNAMRTHTVPDQTALVARAIFPDGNHVMRLYDDLHMVVVDRDFADLFPTRGQPAEAPVRLALATLLQFMKGLTDRQAADAVRTLIDWKYLLSLELADAGFDHTVPSEFRTRLLTHGAEGRLLKAVLQLARGGGLLMGGGRQRSDSARVLGATRTISRLAVVGEAFMREADKADRAVRTLCMTLTYFDCRLSEALALTVDRVDLALPACSPLKASRSGGMAFSVAFPFPRLCLKRSTWCMASGSGRLARDTAATFYFGPGDG